MTPVSDHLNKTLSKALIKSQADKSQQEIVIIHPEALLDVAKVLKEELGFDMLMDIAAVDWKDRRKERYEIVYLFYATQSNKRVTIKATLNNQNPSIASLINIYPAANWAEREAYDMMGYHFEGHPKLERLLMWDEFEGHPLRKDYPIDKRQPVPVLRELL